ncbi:GPO family capsid scaffolding protein [Photorhabdus namnaonensis]|uniref:Phage capsid scaffolding protein (GPO) serine peptidase n=1 Tax=Photorhabdus namnaonensis TaxID=1851568 RepID=A0A1B8YGF0_9GAMM|nr:GPO family capsid scaffolding protein [Photorhabdus namnaonensis]OCA54218.1 Phage capsid scaffolding protein (GPO) serine peptidase [Photorhabdus namnaonensis]
MPKSKFFRVAVEGGTTDGRELKRQDIIDMAETYDPAVYGARVNIEHIKSMLPDGPFKIQGDVTAARYSEITDGPLKGKLALEVQIDPTAELVDTNRARQKVYSSVEMHPALPATGRPYLCGLAVTDNPASLGTEMLKFCSQQPVNPYASRKSFPEALFSAVEETFIEFEGQAVQQSENGKAFFSRITELLTGSSKRFSQETGELRDAVTLIAETQRDTLNKLEKYQALECDHRKLIRDFGKLQSDFTALQTQLETQPNNYSQRPTAIGHSGKSTGDLADC